MLVGNRKNKESDANFGEILIPGRKERRNNFSFPREGNAMEDLNLIVDIESCQTFHPFPGIDFGF